MRVTYEVVFSNEISRDSPIWDKVQNGAVLYVDGLTVDKFYGLIVEINQHKLVVEIPDNSRDILSPDEFVCK